MNQSIIAVYENGLLRPNQKLGLDEGTEVELIILAKTDNSVGNPASILAKIASLPTQGGDPSTSEKHDQILYNDPAS